MVYEGDVDDELESIFLELKDIFNTDLIEFALESRDVDGNMYSDWECVDSTSIHRSNYDEEDMKKDYIERFPQIKENLLEEVYHYN